MKQLKTRSEKSIGKYAISTDKYIPTGVIELAECGSLDAQREIRRLKKQGYKMPPTLWPLPKP